MQWYRYIRMLQRQSHCLMDSQAFPDICVPDWRCRATVFWVPLGSSTQRWNSQTSPRDLILFDAYSLDMVSPYIVVLSLGCDSILPPSDHRECNPSFSKPKFLLSARVIWHTWPRYIFAWLQKEEKKTPKHYIPVPLFFFPRLLSASFDMSHTF